MNTFADRVEATIKKTGSYLVAGFDPVIEKLPTFILEEADKNAGSDSDYLERVLFSFSDVFLAAVVGRVAAIKPNIAFSQVSQLSRALANLSEQLGCH